MDATPPKKSILHVARDELTRRDVFFASGACVTINDG